MASAVDLAVVEQWLTELAAEAMRAKRLDERGAFLGIHATKSSLDLAGLSRAILERHFGLTNETIDRLYRGLFVYSIGLHSTLVDLTKHCAQGPLLVARFWQSYLRLLETSDPTTYQLSIVCLAHENSVLRADLESELQSRLLTLTNSTNLLATDIVTLEAAEQRSTGQAELADGVTTTAQRKLDSVRLASVLRSDEQRARTQELDEWRWSVHDKQSRIADTRTATTRLECDYAIVEHALENWQLQLHQSTEQRMDLTTHLDRTAVLARDAQGLRDVAYNELRHTQRFLKIEQATRSAYTALIQSERESSASLTLSIEAEIDNVEQLENERAELVLQSQVVAVTIDALKQDRLKAIAEIDVVMRGRQLLDSRRLRAASELAQLVTTQEEKLRVMEHKGLDLVSAQSTQQDLQTQVAEAAYQDSCLARNVTFARYHLKQLENMNSRVQHMYRAIVRTRAILQMQLKEEQRSILLLDSELDDQGKKLKIIARATAAYEGDYIRVQKYMAACLRDSQRSCLERNDEAHAIAMTDREVETDTAELVQQQSNLEVELAKIRETLNMNRKDRAVACKHFAAAETAKRAQLRRRIQLDRTVAQQQERLAQFQKSTKSYQSLTEQCNADHEHTMTRIKLQLDASAVVGKKLEKDLQFETDNSEMARRSNRDMLLRYVTDEMRFGQARAEQQQRVHNQLAIIQQDTMAAKTRFEQMQVVYGNVLAAYTEKNRVVTSTIVSARQQAHVIPQMHGLREELSTLAFKRPLRLVESQKILEQIYTTREDRNSLAVTEVLMQQHTQQLASKQAFLQLELATLELAEYRRAKLMCSRGHQAFQIGTSIACQTPVAHRQQALRMELDVELGMSLMVEETEAVNAHRGISSGKSAGIAAIDVDDKSVSEGEDQPSDANRPMSSRVRSGSSRYRRRRRVALGDDVFSKLRLLPGSVPEGLRYRFIGSGGSEGSVEALMQLSSGPQKLRIPMDRVSPQNAESVISAIPETGRISTGSLFSARGHLTTSLPMEPVLNISQVASRGQVALELEAPFTARAGSSRPTTTSGMTNSLHKLGASILPTTNHRYSPTARPSTTAGTPTRTSTTNRGLAIPLLKLSELSELNPVRDETPIESVARTTQLLTAHRSSIAERAYSSLGQTRSFTPASPTRIHGSDDIIEKHRLASTARSTRITSSQPVHDDLERRHSVQSDRVRIQTAQAAAAQGILSVDDVRSHTAGKHCGNVRPAQTVRDKTHTRATTAQTPMGTAMLNDATGGGLVVPLFIKRRLYNLSAAAAVI